MYSSTAAYNGDVLQPGTPERERQVGENGTRCTVSVTFKVIVRPDYLYTFNFVFGRGGGAGGIRRPKASSSFFTLILVGRRFCFFPITSVVSS